MKKFFGVLAFTSLFILSLASNLALQKRAPAQQTATPTPVTKENTARLSCTVIADSTNTTTKKLFDRAQLVPVEVGVDGTMYFNDAGFIAFKSVNAGGPAYQDTDARRLGGRGPYLLGELLSLDTNNLSVIPITAFPQELNEIFTNADPANSGFAGAGNDWFFLVSAQCEECDGPLSQSFIKISKPLDTLENIPIPKEYSPITKVTLGGMEGYAQNTNDKTLAHIVGLDDTKITFSLKNKPGVQVEYDTATKQWRELAQNKTNAKPNLAQSITQKIKESLEKDECSTYEYNGGTLVFVPHQLQKAEAKQYGFGKLLDIYFVDSAGQM